MTILIFYYQSNDLATKHHLFTVNSWMIAIVLARIHVLAKMKLSCEGFFFFGSGGGGFAGWRRVLGIGFMRAF